MDSTCNMENNARLNEDALLEALPQFNAGQWELVPSGGYVWLEPVLRTP